MTFTSPTTRRAGRRAAEVAGCGAGAIVAAASAGLGAAAGAAPGVGLRVPGPDVFFPSAASIPPVNIMNAEPPAPRAGNDRHPPPAAPKPARSARPQRRSAARPPRRPRRHQPERARAAPPPPRLSNPPLLRISRYARDGDARSACYNFATSLMAMTLPIVALHLIKLCVGCDSVKDLEDWIRERLRERTQARPEARARPPHPHGAQARRRAHRRRLALLGDPRRR